MTSPKLIAALIILLGVLGGYLYYSQLLPATEPISPPPIGEKDGLKQFENFKIDFSIINNQLFRSLAAYGEAPVNPGVTGKKDIFAPF